MGMNKSKGNMYKFINMTWNTIKGACPHDCSYCSIKRIAKRFNQAQKPPRFDESELNTNMGEDNYIFVGSSNDLFAAGYPDNWVRETLYHCVKYPDNRYLFQTKNPEGIAPYKDLIPDNATICLTLESNRHYRDIMRKAPVPYNRALHFRDVPFQKMITIEPILDFGLGAFVEMIKSCNPIQVNIGADSGNNRLPEPSWDKVVMLINRLNEFTKVVEKPNLGRLNREGEKTLKDGE